MRGQAAGLLALGAMMTMASPARAGIDEIHFGVMDHNVCITNCKNADKEDSPNIEGQISFDSPSFLHWALSPQPYIMGSYNTQGDTSFGAVGLEWRWDVSEHWAIEPGLGYAIHNGVKNNPYANGTPESADFSSKHVLLGSRDLFRTSLGVTYDMDGPWEVQAYFEHLSHGQILGHGRNQGLDELGIRIGYQFGQRHRADSQ